MATAAKALLERLLAETQAQPPDPARLAPLFLMLKKHVRDLHGRASEVRDMQVNSKEEEAMHKELVTLQWQRAQLTQEIAQSLATPQADLVEMAPHSNGDTDMELDSIDARLERKLKRTQAELESRKALKMELDKSTEDQKAAAKTLEDHKAILLVLPKNLETISEAAQAVQGLLGVDAMDRVLRLEQVRTLEAPLFTAYRQLEAYNEVHGQAVSLSVEGASLVVVVLSPDGNDRIKLTLSYSTEAKRVVVDAPLGWLDGLFPDDPPMPVSAAVKGVSFKFLQAMCGIYELYEQQTSQPTARQVLDKIREKLASTVKIHL